MHRRRRSLLPLFALCAAALSPVAGLAADTAPPLRLELNRLEAREAGCRVWLVLGNPAPEALDPLRVDLVLFGRDGVVARRLAVDLGPLPAQKTTARIFDVTGLPCDAIGSVLLNDILVCGGDDPEVRAACIARAALSSRAEHVPFEK